jgi:hypothetical protein
MSTIPPSDKMDILIAEALKKYPAAKPVAVKNFCFSAPDDKQANFDNIRMDQCLYSWKNDTVEAIQYVLRGVDKL